jgi:hypothetical protein
VGRDDLGFVSDGFDTFVFWPVDPTATQVELLAGEVIPRGRIHEIAPDFEIGRKW